MKRLFLVRHAKSSWSQIDLSDFDRPLNDRGKRDAPIMAERLRKNKTDIDALISSPALRAKSTARLFAQELDIKEKKIIYVDALYHAGIENFYAVIENLNKRFLFMEKGLPIRQPSCIFIEILKLFSGKNFIPNTSILRIR